MLAALNAVAQDLDELLLVDLDAGVLGDLRRDMAAYAPDVRNLLLHPHPRTGDAGVAVVNLLQIIDLPENDLAGLHVPVGRAPLGPTEHRHRVAVETQRRTTREKRFETGLPRPLYEYLDEILVPLFGALGRSLFQSVFHASSP